MKTFKSKFLAVLMAMVIMVQPLALSAEGTSDKSDTGNATTVVEVVDDSDSSDVDKDDKAVDDSSKGNSESSDSNKGSEKDEGTSSESKDESVKEEPEEQEEVVEEETEKEGILSRILAPFTTKDSLGYVSSVTTYKWSLTTAHKFKVTSSKYGVKDKLAFCAEHEKTNPPKGAKFTAVKLVTNSNMRKVLYYGYGGPARSGVSNDLTGYVYTSQALSMANGHSNSGYSGPKSWYNKIKKKATPPSSFKVYIANTPNGRQDICFWTYNPVGKCKIKKTSTDSAAKAANGYSLAGAKYGIYSNSSCTTLKKSVTTNSSGVTSEVSLSPGTYYVKEISAPAGFSLSTKVTKVTLKDGDSKTVSVSDVPKKGSIQIKKSSDDPDYTDGKDSYSLAGAVYYVYSNSACTSYVGKLTTDKTGLSNKLAVYAGDYWIKEKVAPANYELDTNVYPVTVGTKSGTPEAVRKDVVDEHKGDPIWVLLQKTVSEEDREAFDGDIPSLAGAEFTIRYYEGIDWTDDPAKLGATPNKTWVLATDENGFITFDEDHLVRGDEFWIDDDGIAKIHEGTITIEETKAPEGYKKIEGLLEFPDGSVIDKFNSADGDYFQHIITYSAPLVEEPIIRGDLEFHKVDSKTDEPLEGVKFDVVNKKTNEVVMSLVTDENGYATTKSDNKPDGSLVVGDYILKETEPLPGYAYLDDFEFSITEEGTVDASGDVIKDLVLKNKHVEIGTTAVASDTNDHETMPSDETTIIDTVAYKNLTPGKEYTVKGILMVQDTDEPLLIDGKEVTAEAEFVPTEADGTIDLVYTFNSSELGGKSVVVFEDLYVDDIKVASHADINDEGQTVKILKPEIGTTVIVPSTDSQLAVPDGELTITDKVEYKNLVPGKEYILKGYLVDKGEGRLLRVDGEQWGSDEGGFIGDLTGGSEGEEDKVDNPDDDDVTEPSEPSDGDSTGDVVDLSDDDNIGGVTDPSEPVDEDNTGDATNPDDENDENIEEYPGSDSDDEDTSDDKYVTSIIKFTSEEKDGVVEVPFTFNAKNLVGKKVVVFEELYSSDGQGNDTDKIAEHKDINDEGQTIEFPQPELQTTATDKETGTHESYERANVTIVDVVKYQGLIPGQEYNLLAKPYVKSTGEPLKDAEGNDVTATKTFTAENADGEVEIEVTFDATGLRGDAVVMFEGMFYKDVLIGVHADINDEGQTVKFKEPEIGTKLTGKDGSAKEIVPDKNTVLIDTISYEGVVPGVPLKATGVLMDKATGKELVVNGKTVTAETVFTPDKEKGTAEVRFVFDSTDMYEVSLVAFEELDVVLDKGESKIAEHKDINDAGQTVKFTKKGVISTGIDTTKPFILGGIFLLILAAIVVVVATRRKKVNK